MPNDLELLIFELSNYEPIGKKPQPSSLKFIKNYPRFILILVKILEMVGLDNIKIQISQQIRSFVVNYRRFENPSGKKKLHTILYGPPGCGKTQLGKYMAELWSISGCLKIINSDNKSKLYENTMILPPGNNHSSEMSPNILTGLQDRSQILRLEKEIFDKEEKIKNFKDIISKTLPIYNNLRKKVIAKNPKNEKQIQAKFQKIKTCIQEIVKNDEDVYTNVLPIIIDANHVSEFDSDLDYIFDPSSPDIYSLKRKLEKLTNNEIEKVNYGVVTKGDLVGKYQGHTTAKVRDLFKKYEGGVIFIDEAYSVCTSDTDTFGIEILTEIINYMSSHPDKLIFIFAGYRDKMEETVLSFQPGLARRFNWCFDIDGYNSIELFHIFEKQLMVSSRTILDEDRDKILETFNKNVDNLPFFGGDTERLSDIVGELCDQDNWKIALKDKYSPDYREKIFSFVNFDIISRAFDLYIKISVTKKEKGNKNLTYFM